MRNTYMRIRGAIGFKKGLGVDEIEFDLKDKIGLVVLAGPNGKGKTTFLELMSLYRTLASRKGSLKHHFFLRDSIVEHKFIYDGDEYHIIWKIDSGSDRSESFIIVNGESVVNGKNKEYDKYIINKFGSANLFYNSVFCAQDSESMAGMTAGNIKDLFIEFLQIERLEEYRKSAKAGVEFYQKKLDVLSGQIQICKDELGYLNHTEESIDSNKKQIALHEKSISMADKEIKSLVSIINDLKLKSEIQKTDIERRKELGKELGQLILDRDKAKSKIALNTKEFNQKKELFDKDILEINLILADKDRIFNAASRIENLEKLEKYFSDCFECSVDELSRFHREIEVMNISKNTVEIQLKVMIDDPILDGFKTMLKYFESKKIEIESNQSILESNKNSAKNDFSLMQASKNLESCREKIALSIDPDCISKKCPAIDMVSDAKKSLPELEKIEADLKKKNEEKIIEIDANITLCKANIVDVDDKIDRCSIGYKEYSIRFCQETERLNKEIKTFDETKDQLISDSLLIDDFKFFYRTKLSDIRYLIENSKHIASKKSQFQVAKGNKKSIETQIIQLEKDFSDRKKELSDQFDRFSSDILSKENATSDIDKNIDLDIRKNITSAESDKEYYSNKKNLENIDILELKKKAAVLENDLIKKKNLSRSLKEKKLSGKVFEKELSEWDYLRLACSKTGLQALEIDGAVPSITTEGNTLLEKAFGLDSQIRIITQDEETGKEVFQIKVIREDGAEDDFGNLSGGQKVWIAKALSLGMTLVSKRKSGRKFDSLYADEEDGALDGEKALEFVQLYRSMMATGDFETCFFISHNPDVVAMADHVIDFGAL